MTETPESPLPTLTPANSTAPGRTPSLLNEAQLTAITRAEEIGRVALEPEHLGPLTTLDEGEEPGEDDVTEAGIRALLALCEQARSKSTAAVGATGTKLRRSAAEDAAERDLLALIRFFQARARQKHFFKDPSVLREYGIGQDIDDSRALLEQSAQAIYDKTATDRLPKITPAKRDELRAALDAYKAAQTAQTTATGSAGGERFDRDALVREATTGRMKIQFAADAEWPHTNPANQSTRRQFQLPTTRPYQG